MSGQLRDTWTFPKRASVLIAALEAKRADLIHLIDEKLEGEQAAERDLNAYRERLRVAGVENWSTAFPESKRGGGFSDRDIYEPFRREYQGHVRNLGEVDLFIAALRDDQEREPDRLYKLHRDDLAWFGLATPVASREAES